MSVTWRPGRARGKGFVTGRVDEGDRLALPLHPVRTDVLGNTPGFAGDHVVLRILSSSSVLPWST